MKHFVRPSKALGYVLNFYAFWRILLYVDPMFNRLNRNDLIHVHNLGMSHYGIVPREDTFAN